eukprot:13978133-Heterocapsa_arctica.AAC.1
MPSRQECAARRSGPLSAPLEPRTSATNRLRDPRQAAPGIASSSNSAQAASSSTFDPIAAM